MTILTPRFDGQVPYTNGSALGHVVAAHEPTGEGEPPPLNTAPAAPAIAPAPAVATRKIALIGTAPSSRMLAPYNDPSWEIWACSPGNMNALPRVNLWFELHSNLLWPEHVSYGQPYIDWLKLQQFPIYMQAQWPTAEGAMVPLQTIVPNALAFPRDEMVAIFGDSFFTSSFAWMMALAIQQGATEIALYGIDMASRDEYIRQRPGFFFFRYMAQQRGIKVSAPHESDIMQSPALYAYVDSTPFGRKIMARRQEVVGRVNGMIQQRDQLANSITYLQGAQEDLDYFESIWSGVCNDMGRIEHENVLLRREIDTYKVKIAALMAPKLTFEPMTSTLQVMGAEALAAAVVPGSEPKPRRRRNLHEPKVGTAPDDPPAPIDG